MNYATYWLITDWNKVTNSNGQTLCASHNFKKKFLARPKQEKKVHTFTGVR